MGGRSKFSFPIPGRKHNIKESSSSKTIRTPESPASTTSASCSKAQRILGTDGDLNIDSPTWNDIARSDDQSWRGTRPRSSGMSISISESTQSTHESEGGQDRWDQESGVFPRARVRGKASSNALGPQDEMGTDSSSLAQRLRNHGSSSTIRSFYDRQKSPLSISQQTSESSARDLALRKGFPPVTQQSQRSSLLQVDNYDPFHEGFSESYSVDGDDHAQDKTSRKKPAKLDLSMLFARARKPSHGSLSPSSIMSNGSHQQQQTPRKLTKAPSKDSLQSQKPSLRSKYTTQPKVQAPKPEAPPNVQPSDSFNARSKYRETHGTLDQLYDSYHQVPGKAPYLSRIPESRVATPEVLSRSISQRQDFNQASLKSRESRSDQEPQAAPAREAFSWKNVRNSMASSMGSSQPSQPSPAWEASSGASVSSRTSRTSRHTSTSMFSTDLLQNSVLSLSSDSESESEMDTASRCSIPARSPLRDAKQGHIDNQSPNSKPSDSIWFSVQHIKQPARMTSRSHRPRKNSLVTPFMAIPEVTPPEVQISKPQESPSEADVRILVTEKRMSRRTSSVISSDSQQPTPPLSPSSVDLRRMSTSSGRLMNVTKQEEALLEALRQKRANMRENIIKEHEKVRNPPEFKKDRSRSRMSEASSNSTIRGKSRHDAKEEILLYLDTPLSDIQAIDAAEPSPDLGDFLTMGGSDDELTPRNSRTRTSGASDRPRPDSSVSPYPGRYSNNFSPLVPSSTVRLSAIGTDAAFRERRKERREKKRTPQSNVRFMEGEPEAVWGRTSHF